MFVWTMCVVLVMFEPVIVYSVCFFFFKQKTAYEMRISDWSSDVCSSDLRRERQISLRDDRACPRPGRNAPHPASHIPPKRAESGYIQPKANDARWLSDWQLR